MIRLTSLPTQEAVARLAGCATVIQNAIAAGDPVPKAAENCYRHPEVKGAIIAETNEKCAYCEAKVTHIAHGDVEHIKPKSLFPQLRLDYSNLTLSCQKCNNNKGDYHADAEAILDPYTDEPADHVIGAGAFVWHFNGSALGQRTIDLLDLNREALLERRYERIKNVSNLADRFIKTTAGQLKDALADQLRYEADDSSEFALAVRSFLRAVYDLDWRTI